MAYAALAAAGIVLVVIVAAVLRRDSRHWMRRPVMADYRATVTGLGLTTAQQKRLERLTRRGRAVPAQQVRAAALYARAVHDVRRRARTPVRRRIEIGGAVFGVVIIAFNAWRVATGDLSAILLVVGWTVAVPAFAFAPAFARRFDERLQRAIDRDAVECADDTVR